MATVEVKVPGGRQKPTPLDNEDISNFTDVQNDSSDTETKQVLQNTSLGSSFPSQTNLDQPRTLSRKKSVFNAKKVKQFFDKMSRVISSTGQHGSGVDLKADKQKELKDRTTKHAAQPGEAPKNGGVGTILKAFENLGTRDKLTKKQPFKLENGKLPGIVGIRNHGNTCFMNAVVQCLTHTDLLVEYFVVDHYKEDIKRNNKQNAKKFGTKGELTEHLALLMKSLWTCQYIADISNNFKSVVGKYGSQYRGYSQHDAQEFLLWLLDKVHEDLNVATKRKYRTNKVYKALASCDWVE